MKGNMKGTVLKNWYTKHTGLRVLLSSVVVRVRVHLVLKRTVVGKGYLSFNNLRNRHYENQWKSCLLLVVQPLIVWRSNNAIHRINLYPVDNAIIMFCYHLSAGYRFIRWVALSALYTTGPSAVSLVWEKWLVGFDWMLLALRFWCYKSAVIG